MASPMRVDGEGAGGGAGAEDLLSEAFAEVAQGLESVRAALLARERQAEQRAREALRQHEERTAAALREAEHHFRLSLQDGAAGLGLGALRGEVEARLRRSEGRLDAVEERLGDADAGGAAGGDGQQQPQASVEHLEVRMDRLEEAVKKALDEMYPRVEALVARS